LLSLGDGCARDVTLCKQSHSICLWIRDDPISPFNVSVFAFSARCTQESRFPVRKIVSLDIEISIPFFIISARCIKPRTSLYRCRKGNSISGMQSYLPKKSNLIQRSRSAPISNPAHLIGKCKHSSIPFSDETKE
jgi:hypothetical protein